MQGWCHIFLAVQAPFWTPVGKCPGGRNRVDGLRMEAGRPVRVETEEAVWVSGAQAAVGLGGGCG
jgi:hypothetical protein